MKTPTVRHTRLNCKHFLQTEAVFNLNLNEVSRTEKYQGQLSHLYCSECRSRAHSSTADAWMAFKLAAQILVVLGCQSYCLTVARTNPGKAYI